MPSGDVTSTGWLEWPDEVVASRGGCRRGGFGRNAVPSICGPPRKAAFRPNRPRRLWRLLIRLTPRKAVDRRLMSAAPNGVGAAYMVSRP